MAGLVVVVEALEEHGDMLEEARTVLVVVGAAVNRQDLTELVTFSD
jgi:hypothetical protein